MKSERGKKTRRSRKKEERKGGKKAKIPSWRTKGLRGNGFGFVALVDNHGFIGIVVYSGCRIHRRNFSNFSSVVCDVY